MPSISATMQPVQGRVLIQINFADTPTAKFARVLRILADGTETVVRPHTFISTSGDYIELSGGSAVLYDTEAPLDVPLSYRTEGLGLPASTSVVTGTRLNDSFTRVVANGWGAADTGQTYLLVGPAADFSVNGTQGVMSVSAVNSFRITNPQPIAAKNISFMVDITVPVLALTQPIVTDVWLRALSSTTHVKLRLSHAPSAAVTLSSFVLVGGVSTGTAGVSVISPFAHVAGAQWRVIGQIIGSDIKMKAFPVATPDPGWQIEYSNSYLPNAGDIDLASFLTAGNTNGLPVAITYDNFLISTENLAAEVLPSGGDLWLKSPLHPWADQRVVLSVPQEPDCIPSSAIFFQAMAEEDRQGRTSTAVVNNRRNPIPMTRLRGGVSSTLGLITRRFVDRNNVIILNQSGDPLFFQGPADYGIPDRYMSVADYSVSRLSSDHRQQWRAHQIPYVTVDRPPGLADGVLGVRWVDLCDLYATFDAASTAGLTWLKVLLGFGSLSPTPTGFRLYSDIPLDFATYGAIPTGGRTYEDLLEDR